MLGIRCPPAPMDDRVKEGVLWKIFCFNFYLSEEQILLWLILFIFIVSIILVLRYPNNNIGIKPAIENIYWALYEEYFFFLTHNYSVSNQGYSGIQWVFSCFSLLSYGKHNTVGIDYLLFCF